MPVAFSGIFAVKAHIPVANEALENAIAAIAIGGLRMLRDLYVFSLFFPSEESTISESNTLFFYASNLLRSYRSCCMNVT